MRMIEAVGVDIEQVGRFRKLPYKSNQSFYKKVFTPAEIKYCLSKADSYQHFAARFAAKEAVIKAVGGSVYGAKDIEVINDKDGKPLARIKNRELGIMISLSHAKEYAIAIAVI